MGAVVRDGWVPSWLPARRKEEESGAEDMGGKESNESRETTLVEELSSEQGGQVVPVVEMDAVKVRIREYEEREKDGRINRQAYRIEWKQLVNSVVGYIVPEGGTRA